MDYLDLELEISTGRGQEYSVAVLRSPGGEARETILFTLEDLILENRLQALEIALLRSAGDHRQVLSANEQVVQDFSRELFDTFFTGSIRGCYEVSRREAAAQGKGLRLKLRIQPPELATLPWEFLYDTRRAEYICLSRSISVVRYMELPQPIQPLTIMPPLHILGVVVSPRGLEPLNISREKKWMETAIEGLQGRGLVKLTWLEGGTWRDLQRAMRRGPWHVFHFIGHGGFNRTTDEGFIALSDEDGDVYHLTATNLGRLLADHEALRLVILNACEGARGGKREIFSSTAAILVRRGVPAVLAMQYTITDRAAIEFSRAFYEALSDHLPVDAATIEARKAIGLEFTNTLEWGVPALYMRTPNGVLFDFPDQADEAKQQETPQASHDISNQEVLKHIKRKGKKRAWQYFHQYFWIPIGLILLLLVVLVSFLIFSPDCMSGFHVENWKNIDVPFEEVNMFVINPKIPNTWYAGTLGHGAFRSEDGGITWRPFNMDFTGVSITKIVVDLENPSTVYLATDSKGIIKSTDGGRNWYPTNSGLTFADVRDIVIDPNDNKTIYIGTWGGGVFKSLDSGATWRQMNLGLSDQTIQALAIDLNESNMLYAGTHFNGVFITKDGANSWEQTSLKKADVRGLAISPKSSYLVFASTWGDGVLLTTDRGVHWDNSNTGITDFSLRSDPVIDPQDYRTLYVGAWSGGVFASTNEGKNWFVVSYVPKVVRSIVAVGNTVYIGAHDGVYSFTRVRKTPIDCVR